MTGATSGAGTTFLPELQNMTGGTSEAGTTFPPWLFIPEHTIIIVGQLKQILVQLQFDTTEVLSYLCIY
jgi:hypothetical protein